MKIGGHHFHDACFAKHVRSEIRSCRIPVAGTLSTFLTAAVSPSANPFAIGTSLGSVLLFRLELVAGAR